MIDLWKVLASGLWILGLAVILAGLSWAHWIAATAGIRLGAALRRPDVQRVLDVGLALFCVGLAATGRARWEQVLWGALAVAWGVHAGMVGRKREQASL